MEHEKVAGFARALVASSYRQGKTCAIQTGGLGSLEPNTLLLGWPDKWQETGHRDSGEVSACCVRHASQMCACDMLLSSAHVTHVIRSEKLNGSFSFKEGRFESEIIYSTTPSGWPTVQVGNNQPRSQLRSDVVLQRIVPFFKYM